MSATGNSDRWWGDSPKDLLAASGRQVRPDALRRAEFVLIANMYMEAERLKPLGFAITPHPAVATSTTPVSKDA